MENKIFNWEDVEISIFGQTYKPKPIEYTQGRNLTKFQGNITIIEGTHNIPITPIKFKKLSKYQIKKLWKKFQKAVANYETID